MVRRITARAARHEVVGTARATKPATLPERAIARIRQAPVPRLPAPPGQGTRAQPERAQVGGTVATVEQLELVPARPEAVAAAAAQEPVLDRLSGPAAAR